jgi:hypothetical protein
MSWSYQAIFRTLFCEKPWISKLLWMKTWKRKKCACRSCKNLRFIFQNYRILPKFNAKSCRWKNSVSSMKFLPQRILLYSSWSRNLVGRLLLACLCKMMVRWGNSKNSLRLSKLKTCTSKKTTSGKKDWLRKKSGNSTSFKQKHMMTLIQKNKSWWNLEMSKLKWSRPWGKNSPKIKKIIKK